MGNGASQSARLEKESSHPSSPLAPAVNTRHNDHNRSDHSDNKRDDGDASSDDDEFSSSEESDEDQKCGSPILISLSLEGFF